VPRSVEGNEGLDLRGADGVSIKWLQ
jgi:hypothetical protein